MSKTLETIVKAKDEASDTFKKVGNEAENAAKKGEGFFAKMAKEAKANKKDKRSSGEGALGEALGSGRGLVDFAMDKLGIGMPAMVVEKVGEMAAQVTGKMLEVQKSLRSGTKGWGDVLVDTVEELPIVGKFATAGKNIREMITHEKEEIEETDKQTQITTENSNRMVERSKQLKNSLRELTNEKFSISLEMKMVGKEGYEAGLQAMTNAGEAALHGQKDKYEKSLEALDENHKQWVDQRRAKMDEIKKRLPVDPDDLKESKGYHEAETYRTMKAGLLQEEKDYKAKREKIAAEMGVTTAELEKLNGERRVEFIRQANERATKLLTDFGQSVRSSHEMNFAESMRQIRDEKVLALRASGNTLAADRKQAMANVTYQSAIIDQTTEDKIAKIRSAAEETAKNLPEEKRGDYWKTVNAQIDEERQSAALRKKNLESHDQYAASALIKNALDEANLAILQKMVDAGDARAAAELEEIKRLNEELALRKNLEDMAGEKSGLSDNERAAAKKRLTALDEANAKRTARRVQDIQLDMANETAETAASANDRLEAKKQAVRIQMEREFAEKKAQVEKVLGDKNSTDAQKIQAQAEFEAYKKNSARRFDKALGAEAIPIKAMSDAADTLFGQGAELKAQQKADYQKDIATNTAEGTKFLESINGKLDKLNALDARPTVGVPY